MRDQWKLSSTSWHGRAYLFWWNHKVVNRTRRYERMTDGGYRRRNDNLCHYVRVVLFWSPLYWFWFAKFPIPFVTRKDPSDPDRYLSPLFYIAASGAVAVYGACWRWWPFYAFVYTVGALVLFGGVGFAVWMSENNHWRKLEMWLRRHGRDTGPAPEKDDTFVHVLVGSVVAAKHRVCPLIEIVERRDT